MILIRVQRVVLKTDYCNNLKINASESKSIIGLIFKFKHIKLLLNYPKFRKSVPKYGTIEKSKIILL